ncbi:MAG: NnrS family protein [Gammaproteobacteria bacterium]|nr:NnrS family protein [Gammaproteobacteria bacterium]MCP4982243.1 NnrS family protein [Gammaproteobacteria bacterium]
MLNNIIDSDQANRILPLFRLAFRPFFLGGAVFSLVAMVLWGAFWLNAVNWTPHGGWMWWHAHEMLFGFVCTIITGFLLTAVQNWTGQESINSWPLAALFSLWLLARLGLLFPVDAIKPILPWLDLAFLPVVAMIIARLVWRVRQYHNLVFVPFLLLLTISNAQMHWAVFRGDAAILKQASHSSIFLIILIMIVLGGRVIPFFTANATATSRNTPNLWIETLSIASVAALALIHLTGLFPVLPTGMIAALFLVAGLTHLLRFLKWRPWITLKHPLLWSLHGAYLFIVLGFFLCALRFAGLSFDGPAILASHYTTILHSFTLGGMGMLILGMMARVALGHTGRMLVINPWMSFAFACVGGAYICRTWLPLLWPGSSHYASYLLSIALWLLGYGLFVAIYLPVLCQPRIDGRPG